MVERRDGRLVLRDGSHRIAADEVIAVTGFRPDLTLLGELRSTSTTASRRRERLLP